MLGTNVGHGERPDPAALREAGCTAVRLVVEPHRDDRDYLLELAAAGIRPLLVLARESFRDEPRRPHLDAYRARYAHLAWAWQAGNEPDLDSPSSWTMSPQALLALTYEVRDALPDATLVAAGLASGQPGWLWAVSDIVELVQYVAAHPYGRTPDASWGTFETGGWGFGPVRHFLESYRQYGKPLVVSEYGAPDWQLARGGRAQAPGLWIAHRRELAAGVLRRRARGRRADRPVGSRAWDRYADYVGGMTAAVRDHPAVEAAFQFAWSDAVPGFGLHRSDGSPKPAYDRFMEEATKAMPPQQFEIGPGFLDVIARHGLVPLGPETWFIQTPGRKMSICPTDRYLLWWVEAINEIRMQPWQAP